MRPSTGGVARAAALGAAVAALGLIGACNDDGGSAQELCALVGDGEAFGDRFADGLDPTDREQALAQLRAAEVDLEALREAAPSEIRDALAAELDYLTALAEVLRTVDPDDPAAVVEEVNALAEERSAAEAAALELRAFQLEHCGTVPAG